MNKKQMLIIAIMIAAAVLFSAFVLQKGNDKNPDAAEGASEHPVHTETEGHEDNEHHDSMDAVDTHTDDKSHSDEEHHAASPTKGPNGGELFIEGDVGLEVQLVEGGGEAHFRLYLSANGKPLPPTQAKVAMTLSRPDGSEQGIALLATQGALQSRESIAEPHYFSATITVQRGDSPVVFSYERDEGAIEMSDAQMTASSVTLAKAAAARIKSSVLMPGEIRFNEDRTAHIVPRVAGIVESAPASLGQEVKKGALLAVIASTALAEQRSEFLAAQKRLTFAQTTYAREKQLWEDKISAQQDYQKAQEDLREAEIALQNVQQKLNALGAPATVSGSLNRFEVRAPFAGTIIEKHVTVGESIAADASIFTLSDLSNVWAEIVVPAKDLDQVRVGGEALVRSTASGSHATGKIAYVGSLIGEQTRSAKARVVLENPQSAWRPGLYVNVELTASEVQVPVAIVADALQTVEDRPVVFLRVANGFLPQPVVIGQSDGKFVEIVKGLKPGAQYAAAGSFVIKAELGKGSASHEH